MRREVQIVNELGLHARPAAEFVRCAMKFRSEIVLRRGDDQFSAASIIEVMSANLDCGAKVIVEAIGPDAEDALDELEKLIAALPAEERRNAT